MTQNFAKDSAYRKTKMAICTICISVLLIIQLAKIAQVTQVIDNMITVTWNFAKESA